VSAEPPTFRAWLDCKLGFLHLDVEAYGEYVAGIMDDEDTDMEERTALVLSILEGAAEEDSADMGGEALAAELAAAWERYQEKDRMRAVEAVVKKEEASRARLEEDVAESLQNKLEEEAKALEWNSAASKKERHAKHKLVNQYGCDVTDDDVFDEEGNIRTDQKDRKKGAGDGDSLSTPYVNANKEGRKQEQAQARDLAKKSSKDHVRAGVGGRGGGGGGFVVWGALELWGSRRFGCPWGGGGGGN
jgi:hypothetical protein